MLQVCDHTSNLLPKNNLRPSVRRFRLLLRRSLEDRTNNLDQLCTRAENCPSNRVF